MTADPPDPARFTLADLLQAARSLLASNPEPILAYRLLREVLRLPPGDPELSWVKKAALQGKWVRQLEQSQLSDGSWGRFHSQDTKKKTVFRTTEEAIDRAFALGLDPGDELLKEARLYCQKVLDGDARITDRYEKNEAFPLLIQYIVAGRLAQLDPDNTRLIPYWEFLLDIAGHAFASGSYSLEDEADAFLKLTGVHVPDGFLESQHALWILSSRRLPDQLERALLSWIFYKSDGIRYIRAPLIEPPRRQIGYWLRSMNLLARFPSWRELSVDGLNQLWGQRVRMGCGITAPGYPAVSNSPFRILAPWSTTQAGLLHPYPGPSTQVFRLISGFQPDGHRAIVVNLNQHVRAELARLGGHTQVTQQLGKTLHQGRGNLRQGSFGERGSPCPCAYRHIG